MFEVQMQFIPGNDSIWVAQVNPGDPIYQYDNAEDAQIQADTLQSEDPTGRKYRVFQIS
jgi:hypothetical protein